MMNLFKIIKFSYFLIFIIACNSSSSFDDETLISIDEDASVNQNLNSDNSNKTQFSLLALGDSYTIGEGVNEDQIWPNQFNSRPVNEFKNDLDKLLIKINNLKKKNGSVLIISIPDWGSSPFGEGFDRNVISNEINTFNNSLKSFANINGLKYVDVTEISRRAINEPNLIAIDNLHPSGIMYLEWAKKIFQVWID